VRYKKRKEITDEMVNEAIKLHKEGNTIQAIADEMNVSSSHLSKRVRAAGYYPNGKKETTVFSKREQRNIAESGQKMQDILRSKLV